MAGLSDAELLLGLAAKVRAIPEALSWTVLPGPQAEAGGRYLDEAISHGAFSGPEHVRFRVLVDHQKARFPDDWARGVWMEAATVLAKGVFGYDIAAACGPIANAIEAEVARIEKTLTADKDRRMMLLTKAQNIFGFKSPKELTCFLDRHPEVGQDRPLTKKCEPNQRRRRVDALALCEAISRDDVIMSDPARKARMEARLKKAELGKELESQALNFVTGK